MILALSTSRLWWISLHFRALEENLRLQRKRTPIKIQHFYKTTFLKIYRSVCIFSVYLISHLEFWTLFCSKTICLFVVFQVFKKFCLKTCSSRALHIPILCLPTNKKTTRDNIGGPSKKAFKGLSVSFEKIIMRQFFLLLFLSRSLVSEARIRNWGSFDFETTPDGDQQKQYRSHACFGYFDV